MVKIRLRRMGAKKAPFYRVVVADSRSPRDGRFIEELGVYDPTVNPAVVRIDRERAAYWMKNGAQPTDTVRELLKKEPQPAPAAAKNTAAPAETADTAVSEDAIADAAPEADAAPAVPAD